MPIRLFICLATLFLACPGLPGQDSAESEAIETDELSSYLKAIDSVDRDLAEELEKLAELRKRIAAEKPRIAGEAASTALELKRKKRQYEVAKATQASVDHELNEKRDQMKLWRDERLYLDGLLSEFIKNYHGVISLPESSLMEKSFRAADAGEDDGVNAGLDIIEDLVNHLGSWQGIKEIEGAALAPNGDLVDGTFAIGGPVLWFVSDDDEMAGLVRESASLQSELVEGTAHPREVRQLIDGESVELILDPTRGDAIAMDRIEDDWKTYLKKGGLWIYPILLLAAVALAAAIAKWIQLLNVRGVRPGDVQEIIDAVNRDDISAASSAAATVRHPVRSVLEKGIDLASRPIEEVEEALYEKYLEVLPRLQRGLALIAIASATSPLLGLLGTVTGMIKTFNQITIFGTGDARALSGGISEALITTAFGLIVAIPALIVHALLSRKVHGIRATMEMVSLAFINGLKKNA